MTCPICHHAHSDECSVEALKSRIDALENESDIRMRAVEVLRGTLDHNLERADTIGKERDILAAALAKEQDRRTHIARIVAWREATGDGLKEAKEACEATGSEADAREPATLAARITRVEGERDTLRAQLADRQRLFDLVRHQRGPLHDAELISDEEYAALAGDHGAVARLEGYDEMRAQLAEANLTLLNERGEGEPPEPGWRCGGRPEGYADNWYYGVYDSDLSAVIWRSMSSMSSSDGRLVFGWFWRVGPSMIGGFYADPLGHMPTACAAMRAASKRLRGDG